MRFPRVHIKEKDPFAEVLVNSRWRGRESRPRAARTDRCGACAPCELRWQTLSRFLSSAPSRGSIPCGGYIKEKDPFAEVLVNSRWRGRESNPLHEDFQSSALPTELPSHLRCALFQGLISITKDALRSTENLKKVFGHRLGSVKQHVRDINRPQEVFRSGPSSLHSLQDSGRYKD